ncbi:MAG TPA: cyclic nucleotide-binding domain-containing protein [Aliidongia sp.]|uniref:cyclic nucleotide-binding domain-containing protein n=1 Tax=Aliidongia sp. TaxID=1914230 RepID=UPI002DDD0F85|nr:cyclic nucleotide-binding domain-containing protein [Aliidongia sp.]HEV2677713.1 cyclic nucleotide-binding domain-containing protein [Aliidongia sp.]
MSLLEEVEMLRRVPLFADIEPAKLKLIAFTSERVTFDPEQYVFHQGDMGDAAYIIMEGDAEVLIDGPGGARAVARVGRNEFVGEIAILCDVPRTASIRARSRVVTLRISKELFFRLLTDFPKMSLTIMRVIAQRLENTTAQLRRVLAEKQGADVELAKPHPVEG